MAARATRATLSASRAARLTEAVATGPLGALSHDELGVIFDGLADPLQPAVTVALSSTCLGLRTPLRAALEVLKERHLRAKALCRKVDRPGSPCSCAALREARMLIWMSLGLTTNDMLILGVILQHSRLPRLLRIMLHGNNIGDVGMLALCEGLGHGAAPSVDFLGLGGNDIGPAGAEALAGALRRGAMPRLKQFYISPSHIGDQGLAALASPLSKLSALQDLNVGSCGIGDEGVASLLAELGKDDFKRLELLRLVQNDRLTARGYQSILSAIESRGLPALQKVHLSLSWEHLDDSPVARAEEAIQRAIQARAGLPLE